MSSRAAASRKRLVAPTDANPRPSSSKSFFSRSKPTSTPQPVIDLSEPDAFPPAPTFEYPNNDSQAPGPYRGNHYAKHGPYADERFHVPVLQGAPPQLSRKAAPGPTHPSSAYSSLPYESDENQIIRLSARSPRGNAPDEYESGYIEASYQPPPPIQASYQPPPPTHVPTTGQQTRSSRKYAQPSKDFDTIRSFAAPPTYPPSGPSTSNGNAVLPSVTSVQPSLLLQRSSPTPTDTTELPTYSLVHETLYSATASTTRIPLESPRQGRLDYSQQCAPAPYPAPTGQVPRLTPSPFQVSSAHSSSSLPSENDFRRPVYRSGNGASSPSSPFLSTYQVPAAPSNSRPTPESISGSDSSGNSISSRSPSSVKGPSSPATLASPPAPAFVFPGSRSTARPKHPPKSPTFKIKGRNKSRMRTNSDASSTTPPPTPSSAGSSGSKDNRPPVGVSAPNGNGTDLRLVSRKQSSSFSETASAFSDDSSLHVVNQAVTAPRPAASTTASTTSDPASAAPAPQKMIYPGGRSRAKPSKPPIIKPRKSKRPPSTKSNGSDEREEKSRFMGLLKRKKQPKIDSSRSSSADAVSQLPSSGTDSSGERQSTAPSEDTGQVYYEEQYSPDFAQQESMNRAQRTAKSRIGSYPLDPYDSVLLDNDRHTGELLVRLNPTGSPSFHNYGNIPPVSVLDLGCGQGHWVVDAAIAWRGYGTKVTGYDMVDVSKGLLPWAVQQGVTDNIRFVRGNFLKQRLPFSNNSFDLVRMSCLALCVTADSWVFLLQEVCRVLMVGGRLELIDDMVFFPYGKAPSSLELSKNSSTHSIPPQLDISIPTSSFTTFSIYDSEVTNPGLGYASTEEEEDEGDFFDLYEVEEEPEFDDAATLNGRESQPTPTPFSSRPTHQPRRASSPVISSRSWTRAHATSGDLEALFDHMLAYKFGIRKDLHEFILDLLKDVFGHAREMRTMHLALAPPEAESEEEDSLSSGRGRMGLSGSPGLILWPSTFIPMSQSEIEIHASKHLRMLLSCKNFLLEHALEATDDDEIDEESVLEALWEYEGFLRHRFNPPPVQSSLYGGIDQDFDALSMRGSIAESVSSYSREAMWEIQSQFRQRFAWHRSGSTSRSPTPKADTPTTGLSASSVVLPLSPHFSTPTVSTAATSPSHSPTLRGMSTGRDSDAVSSSASPVYSRDELTRVRTFRVYEAIKIDETLFGTAL